MVLLSNETHFWIEFELIANHPVGEAARVERGVGTVWGGALAILEECKMGGALSGIILV